MPQLITIKLQLRVSKVYVNLFARNLQELCCKLERSSTAGVQVEPVQRRVAQPGVGFVSSGFVTIQYCQRGSTVSASGGRTK